MTLFDGLPRPHDDTAVAYVLGRGFGESQVVAFPDGPIVVVDSCTLDGLCLPSALLDWLGCSRPDLLAVTHPDLDHIDGLDRLIADHRPRHTWRYPGYADLGEWVARWADSVSGSSSRLASLRLALDALDALLEDDERVEPVRYGHRAWPSPDADPRVVCLAPAAKDLHRAARPLRNLVHVTPSGEVQISKAVERYLLGEPGRLDRRGNRLSLALIVHWHRHHLLLAGDVEDGADPRAGWKGMLRALKEDERLHEVTDLTLVKAAHHGSNGAWCEEAWSHATRSGPVGTTVITRYDRGRNPPPHRDVLRRLITRTERLALTSTSDRTQDQLESSGWTQPAGRRTAALAPCVAIELPADAPAVVHLGGSADARTSKRTTGDWRHGADSV